MTSPSPQVQLASLNEADRERLAQDPSNVVYETEYQAEREPWKVARLKRVFERVATKLRECDPHMSQFRIQKHCLEGEVDIQRFQLHHPRLFDVLTDPSAMTCDRTRQLLTRFLEVRSAAEAGLSQSEADARASRIVMEQCTTHGDGAQPSGRR